MGIPVGRSFKIAYIRLWMLLFSAGMCVGWPFKIAYIRLWMLLFSSGMGVGWPFEPSYITFYADHERVRDRGVRILLHRQHAVSGRLVSFLPSVTSSK